MTLAGTCLLNGPTKLTESEDMPRFVQHLLHGHDIRYADSGISSNDGDRVNRLSTTLTSNASPNATGRL